MAWMVCRSCSTKFAVGLLRCPQCQAVSELFAVPEEVFEAEQEADMPKISVGGGPSNALGEPVESETGAAAETDSPTEVPESTAPAEPETSGAESDATDEVTNAGGAEDEAAPAPKPARKTAAKKATAKQEPAPKG